MSLNRDFEAGLKKAFEELDPLKALSLFDNIQEEDIILFDMDYKLCHPRDFLVTQMPAPPVCIRPSVSVSQTVTNEDDLTIKLGEIIQMNNVIKASIS